MNSKLNIKPRTIFCHDNLAILEGINSEAIDLIYLDPPFNKKKIFTAPIGSSAEGAEFSDIFRKEDIKTEWLSTIEYENQELYSFLSGVRNFSSLYNYCYLVYMAIRLIECQRILKDTGSIYLHCDPTMSHYLKIAMDCIFNEKNFLNEVIWYKGYRGTPRKRQFQQEHDTVLRYSKTKNFVWNNTFAEYKDLDMRRYNKTDESGKKYARVKRKRTDGTIYYGRTYPKGKLQGDVIAVPTLAATAKERTGYPTQKPLALLERIIEASSNEGDMVLDPFCGCATTCIAAEKTQRQWIGVDISIKAYELVKDRLKNEVPADLFRGEPNFSTKPPKRGKYEPKEKGFVYVISNAAWKGEYKVGVAKDVNARLNQFQTSDPRRGYKLEYKMQTPHFKEVEKHIHQTFENKSEWVKADLDSIIKEIKSYVRKK